MKGVQMRTIIISSVFALGVFMSPGLLAQGSDDVRAEQQALKDKGIDPGPIDGINGPQTRRALHEFQAKQNLAEDGKLGPQTRDALGLKPGSASTDMKESGTNLKTGYSKGGKDVANGGKEMAHDVSTGHPVEAAKDLGKGVGHGVAKMGEGTGHAAKNAAKGVKNAVTGENKDAK
jgi:Putative peptidoglycan binding domain